MKESTRINWHDGFAGGLEICFRDYLDVIDIEREHPLTKESPRIDFVVIKKDAAVVIDNDIGRGFKRYNIIEYKNPDDVLNTDIIWKCIGYASLYKALGKSTDAIPEEELTISVFRSRYPRKFFEYCKRQNRRVEQEAPGVFLVEGFSALSFT